MDIKRGHIDLSFDVAGRRSDWLWRTFAGWGLVLCAALIYQLIVGGVKIDVAAGRLIIDPSGLVYWWHTVTGR